MGVLLVNLGTPDAPTTSAVRRYLAEFLSDRRVVEIPRIVWLPLLYLVVLLIRPARSARAYRLIWSDQGSPLLALSQRIAERLEQALNSRRTHSTPLVLGMRYGSPSIAAGLDALQQLGVQRIIVLPLYPQYSAATGGSVFDAVTSHLGKWRHIPGLDLISDYHQHPAYIDAMATHLSRWWASEGYSASVQPLLLLSFHGLPERTRTLGDPYFDQCHTTARLLTEGLGLADNEWEIVFQSRFGKAAWFKPYCVERLQQLPAVGVTRVDLFCPGFPVDCLETLEEIAITNQALFIEAGGREYRYIPALNDQACHIEALQTIIEQRTGDL